MRPRSKSSRKIRFDAIDLQIVGREIRVKHPGAVKRADTAPHRSPDSRAPTGPRRSRVDKGSTSGMRTVIRSAV